MREGYCQAAFRLRDDGSANKAAIFMRLLASTAAATHSSKRSRPSAGQRFIPRPRNSTEMRPSMPARKRWPLLNSRLFSSGFALGRFGAAPLWDAHHLDASLLARRYIAFAEEAAIRTIQFGHVAEGLLVAFQRSDHVLFVDGVAVQYVILRDQAARAFGKGRPCGRTQPASAPCPV